MGTLIIAVITATNICVVGIGIYLAAYLKKKAQNLATREEFNELKKQTSELAQTTGIIEAEIRGDLWNKQKHWEIKREVIFDASKAVMKMNNMLLEIGVAVRLLRPQDNNPADNSASKLLAEKVQPFLGVLTRFDGLRLLIAIVCDPETVITMEAFSDLARSVVSKIASGDHSAYNASIPDLRVRVNQVQHAFRKELGIPTPQSSGSSAALSPAAQAPESTKPDHH